MDSQPQLVGGGNVLMTEITACARELVIPLSVARVADGATQVVMDTNRHPVVKDSPPWP